MSLSLLAVGVIGLLDLSGVRVSGGVYLAVPLVIVGAALVIGAWYDKARWLIIPGVVLTVVLGITTAAQNATADHQLITWQPTSMDQLQSAYSSGVGDAVLDLSQLDFTGLTQTVSVENNVGNLTIIVPAAVDVRGDVHVDVGNAEVFGTQWAGIGQPAHTVADDGADGPGGGTLVIHAATDLGNVEVRR